MQLLGHLLDTGPGNPQLPGQRFYLQHLSRSLLTEDAELSCGRNELPGLGFVGAADVHPGVMGLAGRNEEICPTQHNHVCGNRLSICRKKRAQMWEGAPGCPLEGLVNNTSAGEQRDPQIPDSSPQEDSSWDTPQWLP